MAVPDRGPEVVPYTVAAGHGAVAITVSDMSLRLALEATAVASGRSVVANRSAAGFVVTDDVRAGDQAVDVLVIEATPFSAFVAVNALLSGAAGTLLSRSEPHHLPDVLSSLERGRATIPLALVEAMRALPQLSTRQHEVLIRLVESHSKNVVLARKLGVSHATLKRELSDIGEHLGVAGRHELAAAARRLGYDSRFAVDEFRSRAVGGHW